MFASAAAQQVACPAYVGPWRSNGPPGRPPERLGDAVRDDHAAERQVAARHALGEHDHVGLHAPALDPEPRSEPAEAADNGVDDQQHTGPLADRRHALHVARQRRVHATGPDHGLDEDARHLLSTGARDLCVERLERVVRHLNRVDLRSESLAVGDDAGERRAEPVGAVVTVRCG